ncbi:MAG: methyltransferase domain-containing protein [Planctomycetota bacterium]
MIKNQTSTAPGPPTRNYDSLAGVYDLLAHCWSGLAIRTAKLRCAELVEFNEKVILVGPGTGIDAVSMMNRGAQLLLIEHSKGMLETALNNCRNNKNVVPKFILGDFRTQTDLQPCDTLVASFFLNVFSSEEAVLVLKKMKKTIKPQGRILISDFAPPPKNFINRITMEIWHGIPMAFFYFWTGNAWHRIHDLESIAEKAGLRIKSHTKFRIFKWGPRWIQSLELLKVDTQ